MSRPYSMQSVEALGETIRRLDEHLQPDHHPMGQHHGIPLRFSYFLGGLCEAESLVQGREFLDVGCGPTANKCLVARNLGWNAFGIDNWRPYIERAMLVAPDVDLLLCDAFEFADYDRFDVVYAYKPRTDNDEEAELEALIVEQMKPGALAFFVGLAEVPGAEPVGGNLWRVK